ncbi:MAG: hypothetical protein FD173_968 [Gallionellaceae bacterium]|nr:MAG: hypothetical protein FD173_968 [Gallionellaceae bacterium]
MTVQLELWHLITLLIAFFTCVGVFGKVLLSQFEKRLDERFELQEEARKEVQKRWDDEFKKIEELARKNERDLLELKVHLAENFVSRPDSIINQSRLESKIDGLAKTFENVLLRLGTQKGNHD